MTKVRYALPIGSDGWWVYESSNHPFEGWRPAQAMGGDGPYQEVYGCLICGGPVGPEEDDYCPNEQCKEVFKQYLLLLKLEVPPAKSGRMYNRFGLDPGILEMSWRKVRDLFIEVDPEDTF